MACLFEAALTWGWTLLARQYSWLTTRLVFQDVQDLAQSHLAFIVCRLATEDGQGSSRTRVWIEFQIQFKFLVSVKRIIPFHGGDTTETHHHCPRWMRSRQIVACEPWRSASNVDEFFSCRSWATTSRLRVAKTDTTAECKDRCGGNECFLTGLSLPDHTSLASNMAHKQFSGWVEPIKTLWGLHLLSCALQASYTEAL